MTKAKSKAEWFVGDGFFVFRRDDKASRQLSEVFAQVHASLDLRERVYFGGMEDDILQAKCLGCEKWFATYASERRKPDLHQCPWCKNIIFLPAEEF